MTTDDSGLSELQKTVGALARTLDRALRKVDQLDAKLTAIAEGIEEVAAPSRPTEPPAPGMRSWLLADDPYQAAADLEDLTAWVWRVYLWWPEAWLSSCWLWHPEVVEELWWLRVAHADAYDPETGTSLRVADWHDRLRPGVAKRVRAVVGKCELNRHIPYNGRPVEVTPPGPPALARHAAAVAAIWCAGAGLDVVRAAGPDPTQEQLAEAAAFQNALYRSRR